MKRITGITIALIILLFATVYGQASEKPFASAFTSAAAESVQFDVDFPDTIGADSSISHRVIYRDPSVTTWNTADMSELYTSCSLYTFSATVEYATSTESLEWYFSSEMDSGIVTQSPKNVSDDFPVPAYLLADLGEDPVGDVEGGGGSHLDIVHAYASYSDQKLYVRLDNNGGGFPTSSGFNFYLYSVGIVDPDMTDSVAFSFVYVNVPFVMTPGLYKLDPSDSSLTRIGDISTNISGNSLSMSCDISDLTSQPEWSDWPPPSGFVVLAPVTATQGLFDLVTNDWGRIAVYLPESQTTDYSVNGAPILSGASASDDGSEAILVQVTYSDPDNNMAVLRRVYIDDNAHDMTACEKGYLNGTLFEATVEVDSTGWYDYYFEFSDGVEMVTTDLDSVYVEVPTYVPGDADGSGEVDIDDVVYLIQYIFSSSPAPDPLESGDADCSGEVDIDDVVYLIEYIFASGPPPC